jgi:hypothetical protein
LRTLPIHIVCLFVWKRGDLSSMASVPPSKLQSAWSMLTSPRDVP